MMVRAAQRHGELVADLKSERPGLRELQVMSITRRALADLAGLGCDERQMLLASPSHRFAQRRDHGFGMGVLVVMGRCDGRRLSSTAVSIRWRSRRGFGGVLLKLLCSEIQCVDHDLTS